MPTTAQDYTSLFQKLLDKGLSPQDTVVIREWLGSDVPDATAAALILKQLEQPVHQNQISPELMASLDARLPFIFSRDQVHSIPFYKRTVVRYAAACILLLATGVGLWLQYKPAPAPVAKMHTPAPNNIAPGKDGAVLTLADGSKVVLDSLGNGVVATQNGATLVLKNGQLVYDNGQAAAAGMAYNTMSTPKGRQFKLLLPDGTGVWLNAASSLRYPVAFTGKERKVEIQGEAYFEVAKLTDPATGMRVPFKVQVNAKTEIEVLGTHFNINSYEEEGIVSTTLLEGSVKVLNNGKSALLQPGQQARVAGVKPRTGANQQIEIIAHADVEKVMAWKNGVFNFQDASLAEVMRQLERWYDIEVVYEKGIPTLEFIGKMGRDLPLTDVLRGLEMSKVHFRIEGRRVIVLP